MMRRLISLSFVILTIQLSAQNVKFDNAKQLLGRFPDYCRDIKLDKFGNIYMAGFFEIAIDIDPGSGKYIMETANRYGRDIFVAKFDPNLNIIWAKQFGGPYVDDFPSMDVDASGNVYFSGNFESAIDMDPGPGTYFLNNFFVTEYPDFICKLDTDGNMVWAKAMDVQNLNIVGEITTDNTGNFYYTTSFGGGTSDIDPGPGHADFIPAGTTDILISKFDTDGNLLWAKQIGGVSYEYPISTFTDNANNFYFTGITDEMIDVDPGPGVKLLTGSPEGDGFLVKLDAAGNFQWNVQFECDEWLYLNSGCMDPMGNIYLTGFFRGTADFDPGTAVYPLSAAQIDNSFGDDIFVCKLTSDGRFIWANRMGALKQDQAYSVRADEVGNCYVSGCFSETVDFDPSVCVFNLGSPGQTDIFIAKYGAAGDLLWAKKLEGPGGGIALETAIDKSGNIYTAGIFSQTVDFDPSTGGTFNLVESGLGDEFAADIFIQKMSPCTSSTSATLKMPFCDSLTFGCKTYTAAGTYTIILENAAGCDSVVTLELTVLPKSYSNIKSSFCEGKQYQGYTTAGTYADTLVAANGCDSIATLELTMLPKIFSNVNALFCEGQQYEGYTIAGTYTDILVATNGCDSVRTLHLQRISSPVPILGKDTSLCNGESIALNPGSFDSYLWSNGSTQSTLNVTQPGLYSVFVKNLCGSASDDIIIENGICDIFFPSAFTPNNDGKNDVFKILGRVNFSYYRLSMYNNWGQKIFETNDPAKGWDGKLHGRSQNAGGYVWDCNFKRQNASGTRSMKGTVLLIR